MAAQISVKQYRMSVKEYLNMLLTHYKKYWKYYSIPVVGLLLIQTVIRIDINYTDSLPNSAFITVKGWKSGLKAGDYVAYRYPSDDPVSLFRKGDHMVKIIGGVGGDIVKRDDAGNYTILRLNDSDAFKQLGGYNVGFPKPFSKSGRPLIPSELGLIPEGKYYVFAPHKDSLDSRYAVVGLIGEDAFIGRTFPIF